MVDVFEKYRGKAEGGRINNYDNYLPDIEDIE